MNNLTKENQQTEIANKIKVLLSANWVNCAIEKNTTQFIINWDKSGMKTIDEFQIKKIEEITKRRFSIMAIHSTKCLSVIFA